MGDMEPDNSENKNGDDALFRYEINRLYSALENDEMDIAVRIIDAMGVHKNMSALEPLIILLEYQDSNVRNSAARALGKLGDRSAVEPLIRLLKDESMQVRESAAIVLGEMGDERALKPLENMDIVIADYPALMNAVRNSIYLINKKKSGPDVYNRCKLCGKNAQILHTCGHCGGAFCDEHMRPADHQCPSLQPPAEPESTSTIKNIIDAVKENAREPAPKKERASHKNTIAIAAAAVIILVLLAGIGVAAYTVLFPAVWTEQLPFKNSTGQYESIVMYRNVTDLTYDNLTKFIQGEDIESLVASDANYRPVEYAVDLHDDAETRGINCTVKGTEIVNNMPEHALDVFYTTDKGLVYVDPTGMNVSQADYDNIPYGSIILLRNTWVQSFPIINSTNARISVTEYRNATPISYDELISFIDNDNTVEAVYDMPNYTCGDFAAHLYDDAEAQGIKSGIVSIGFQGEATGHAINAFPTTDKGIVFVDCTGINQSLKEMGYVPTRNIVYIQVGKELGEIPDNQTGGNLSYSFYDSRKEKIDAYRQKWMDYEESLASYDLEKDDYNSKSDTLEDDIYTFNQDASNYKAADLQYLTNPSTSQYTLEQLNAWFDRLSATSNSLSARQNALNSEKSDLDAQYYSLKATYNSLLSSEEFNWITFNPIGIVSDMEIYW